MVHPDCEFVLDANEGYDTEEAIQVLEKLHSKVFWCCVQVHKVQRPWWFPSWG
ncbi:hypothetical protein IC582_025439 [Cucumis melo]